MNKLVWLIPHPLHQYEGDVVALAREKGFEIVDARFEGSFKKEQLVSDKDKPKLKKLGENKAK